MYLGPPSSHRGTIRRRLSCEPPISCEEAASLTCGQPRWRYARLRHRIFMSILVAVVVTAVFLIFGVHIFDHHSTDVAKIERFVSNRYAQVWNDAGARAALSAEIERTFDVTIVVSDIEGRVLYGSAACTSPNWEAKIVGPQGPLGTIGVCLQGPRRHAKTIALGLLAGVFVLWGASGAITWKLVRPIDELLRVTREIGRGNLAARMRLRRHHRDEVGEIAEAVNDMAVRIERQISDQRELLAAVSHEIRTPLARLRVLVELERGSPGDSKRLDQVEAELVEIDQLVGQLLAQSKLDFNTLDRRLLGANELAASALERAQLSRSLLAPLEGNDLLEVDPSLISRALANIIDNAERHGAGLVELNVSVSGTYIQFAAIDAGPGIDGPNASRMFAPFERGGDKAGLGLGLALVERIARAHGGHAFASPRETAGAVIGFRIPAAPPVALNT